MTKTAIQRDTGSVAEAIKARSGDTLAYRQILDAISKQVPNVEAFIVASVPRGGLQIVQPSRVPDVLVKAYAHEFHHEDRATWMAMQKRKAMRGTDAWGKEYEQSKYLRDFMLYTCNFYHMVAVPLKSPVFAGYPGALHLYRYREQGPFTDAEMAKLTEYCMLLDDAIEKQRQNRRPQQFMYHVPWAHQASLRQFVFDAKSKCVFGSEVFASLDDRLKQQITQHCTQRLSRINQVDLQGDRLQLPDSTGEIWTFRAVPFKNFGAFGNNAYMTICLQPEAPDWSTIRPSDYNADAEMTRLLPTLRFMQQEFHRSPSLGEISRFIHLSPFHFHRRFTELMGLTPKHFLLECQIHETKRQLMSRQKELSQIAADCGFAHQSHFTSRFKQAAGLTPTRWRKIAQDMQRSSV